MSSVSRRFLVLGLDGATFDLLDPLMASGELPFLARTAAAGLRAPLASVYPPKTIPAWYSFATGLDPGALGIFGFTEPDGGPGKSRLVQTYRPSEAIWDRLSRLGHSVGVVNFPMRAGHALNGFVLPGMLSDRPPTYPEGLRDEVERALGEPLIPELPPYREAHRAEWMALATRAVGQRARATEALIRAHHPDFLFVLFRETDRIQHQHWSELTGPPPKVGEDLRGFWREVDRALARIDAAFRAAVSPVATLIISDHGHGDARSDFFTNRWLEAEGFLRFRNGGIDRRRDLLSRLLVTLDRIPGGRRLLRPLADRLRSSPRIEALSTAVGGVATFEAVAPRIDWERTVAYSYPVPEGIYLNRYNSSLRPEAARAALDEIRRRLETFPGARIEVLSPAELYRGDRLENAPALLLRIDGLATEPRMDFSYPRPMLKDRPGYFYGTGVHRMDGILIASGDGIQPERRSEPFSLLDLAPTILSAMGAPIPEAMAGRSFADRFGTVEG